MLEKRRENTPVGIVLHYYAAIVLVPKNNRLGATKITMSLQKKEVLWAALNCRQSRRVILRDNHVPEMQMGLIKNLSGLLKPGGALVYSTCSMEPEENDEIVRRVEREAPELKFRKSRQTLPFRDNVDGAFAALFTRN